MMGNEDGKMIESLLADLELEEDAVKMYTSAIAEFRGTEEEKVLRQILSDEYRHVTMLKTLLAELREQ